MHITRLIGHHLRMRNGLKVLMFNTLLFFPAKRKPGPKAKRRSSGTVGRKRRRSEDEEEEEEDENGFDEEEEEKSPPKKVAPKKKKIEIEEEEEDDDDDNEDDDNDGEKNVKNKKVPCQFGAECYRSVEHIVLPNVSSSLQKQLNAFTML